MDINVGIKLHNRFDIEVKDIKTGKIVHIGQAENIVLDSMFNWLMNNTSAPTYTYAYSRMAYGKGTGTPSATRTTLFNQLGVKNKTVVEFVHNQSPTPSWCKSKIIINPEEHVGETITEVGLVTYYADILLTHALIKDAEGNLITIGPKTDTQEITIYSTVYATVTLPDGILLTIPPEGNALLHKLLGSGMSYLTYAHVSSSPYLECHLFSDKTATNQSNLYNTGSISNKKNFAFTVQDAVNKKNSVPRIRFQANEGNGKVWSISLISFMSSYWCGLFRILMPNSLWAGYHFEGKSIGIGDGSTNKFNLPWSDINTTKEYKIYVDGALKTKDVDYTLSNAVAETSVTFTNAPASNAVITGYWWVDYIPKDADHVLDINFAIQFGEGA
ncbi:MAG: hypothetical protein ABFC28_01540 [Rikenellaceae bacterium]